MKIKIPPVETVDNSYDIEIGRNLFDNLINDLQDGLIAKANRFMIITDSNVKKLYGDELLRKMRDKGLDSELIYFDAGEINKTRETKARLEDQMLSREYGRDTCIIALGGGVVTDMAGFIAGTFGRGVPYINYATTFLAATDAAVGGKCAVDTPFATNQIGMFYQPKKVYIDIAMWATLPIREMRCGFAETVKHAIITQPTKTCNFLTLKIRIMLRCRTCLTPVKLRPYALHNANFLRNNFARFSWLSNISDKEFFNFLEDNAEMILNNYKTLENYEIYEYMAKRNCEIKFDVVRQDERENGYRQILNMGHTIGRAVETLSNYTLLHGEAVSIGIAAQAMISNDLGYITDDELKRMIQILQKVGLPIAIPENISTEVLINKLYTDKKVRKHQIYFVLQDGIGNVKVFGDNQYSKPLSEQYLRDMIGKMRDRSI